MRTLYDRAKEIFPSRHEWEIKQRIYSQMRHEGLRRVNKPFPKAADMHFPLIDLNITKAKPFWVSQATSSERLASFVALKQQNKADTSAAAGFFDFELKQNTNYLEEIFRLADWMLLRGRGALKVTTDPFNDHRIIFEAPDPYFILMCEGADDFTDADEFVHVQQWTKARYKRERRFNQDPAVIQQICGVRDSDEAGDIERDKENREGVNYSSNPNQIIIWEHVVKTMGGWTVNTYSPMKPDAVLRRPFGVPYKVKGKPSLNWFSFKTEIKDKGWYSPRGLAEKNAPFESYLCKLWNEKTDAMTFGNRPVFTSEKDIPNIANIRWNPGEFIPGNIQAVTMPPPAFSFDQEMASARSTSEQVSQLPDFGITQPGQEGQAGSPRTATENNRIAQLQTVGTDSNGQIFRMDLAKLYRHVWGLMLQFKRRELSFYMAGELKQLPEQAMHDAYLIAPDGSSDAWNKGLRIQRAQGRLQMFGNNPLVDQDVLIRDTMAADDPQFALEAFIGSGVKAGSEAEDEAMEIVIMEQGFPAMVKPNEDHATRIHTLVSFLQKMAMTNAPVDPIAKQRISEHMAVHFQFLEQQQPQVAHQLKMQILQMEQASAAQQQQPEMMQPAGGQPMQ